MANVRRVQVGATKSLFDDIIDRHAEAYLAAYSDVKEFSNFEKSGTIKFYIGMVWTNEFEKPDLNQFRIRGSQSLSGNKLVELDLSAVDGPHSFFPGQIVAFKADPFLKKQLTVRKFLDPMRIAPRMKKINTDSKINLIIACGPFMKPDSEDWTLYDKVIANIKSNEATHAILIGPFVDLDNQHIREKFDTNWQLVFDKLVEGLHDHTCQVYLVPSTRDALPSHLNSNYFYPTAEIPIKLNVKSSARPKCTISSVSDPAQIDLGGLYVDVTSAEVLLHFNNCATFLNKGPGSRFTPMFRHLLSHGIYPIYPPPVDTAIDYPKMEKYLQLDRLCPHILVLPSRFPTPLSENIDNRLVVTVHKCSSNRRAVLIEIPKIESSEEAPIDSVLLSNYACKPIELEPAPTSCSQQLSPTNASTPMTSLASTELNGGDKVAAASAPQDLPHESTSQELASI